MINISARFQHGSGGATVIAIIRTSLNQGTTWIDIARFDFTVEGSEKIYNFATNSPITLPSAVDSNNDVSIVSPYTAVDLSSGSEGVINGTWRYARVVVTSTGTYAGSTVLSIRASVRT